MSAAEKLKDRVDSCFFKFTNIYHIQCFYEIYENIFDEVHQYLTSNRMFKEGFFVYSIQILTFVKNIEKILKAEEKYKISLSLCREYFSGMMRDCVLKIHECIDDRDKTQEDFLEVVDEALEFLIPFIENNADHAFYKNPEYCSKMIERYLSNIAARGVTLATISNPKSKKTLLFLSHYVLESAIDFHELCSNIRYDYDIIRASVFNMENNIYRLLICMEKVLIDVIYETFKQLNVFALSKYLMSSDKNEFKKQFPLNFTRVNAIGLFAIAFTTDPKIKIILRSSMETLVFLSSTLLNNCIKLPGFKAQIFIEHFQYEIDTFKKALAHTIDSDKISGGYLEILEEFVQKQTINTEDIENVIFQGTIFLDLIEEKTCDKDIPNKVRGILDHCTTIKENTSEILEQLQILISVLKSFHKELFEVSEKHISWNDKDFVVEDCELKYFQLKDTVTKTSDLTFLKSLGVKPHPQDGSVPKAFAVPRRKVSTNGIPSKATLIKMKRQIHRLGPDYLIKALKRVMNPVARDMYVGIEDFGDTLTIKDILNKF